MLLFRRWRFRRFTESSRPPPSSITADQAAQQALRQVGVGELSSRAIVAMKMPSSRAAEAHDSGVSAPLRRRCCRSRQEAGAAGAMISRPAQRHGGDGRLRGQRALDLGAISAPMMACKTSWLFDASIRDSMMRSGRLMTPASIPYSTSTGRAE